MSDVADALGARPIRVPHAAAVATSKVISRLPFLPSALEWLHAGRTSVVMDTSKAKQLTLESSHEQANVGLDRLSADELARFTFARNTGSTRVFW